MPQSSNPEQKSAIEHKAGPLLIIAGAGTGKTFVITERIIHLINKKVAKASEILALTFTQKAAQEMEERVDISMPYGYEPIDISTFHSFADSMLRQEATYIGLDGNYKLMTSAESYLLFRQHLFEFPLKYFRPPGNPTKYIRDILTHFSRLKDEDITVEDYENFVKAEKKDLKNIKDQDDREVAEDKLAQYEELSKVYKAYEDLKRKNSKLDFGDVITETLRLLRTRKSILKRYQSKYKFILVDEYQDTNYAQNELIYLLSGDDCNITVVGDDDQSIYKFRGAAISNILQFKSAFEEGKKTDVSTVVLAKNYRSHQAILDSAYVMVQHNNPDRLEVSEKINKKLEAMRNDVNPDIDRVRVLHGEREIDELDLIAHNILRLVGREKDSPIKDESNILVQESPERRRSHSTPGGITGQLHFSQIAEDPSTGRYTYKDMAILVRAHAHADEIAKTLKYFRIPFQFVGPRGLYSQEEIKDLISFLQIVNDYRRDLDLIRLLGMDLFSVSVREMIDFLRTNKERRESLLETIEFLLDRKIGLTKEQKDSILPTKEMEVPVIFSEESRAKLGKLLDLVESALEKRFKGRSVGDILYSFLEDSGYIAALVNNESAENEKKVQNITTFFDIIKSFERESESLDVSEFISYLNYSLEIGDNPDVSEILDLPDRNAVNIITIHSSKGLEFPVVFMPNLVNQRFPSRARNDALPIPEELVKEVLPTGDEHTQEERRLFYVGMTRAKDYLYMSYADYYADGKQKRKPSIFLLEAMEGEVAKEFVYARPKGFASIQYAETKEDPYPLPKGYSEKLAQQVSYSQIETYLENPFKYKLKYVLKIPTPQSATLSYGSTLHNTLKAFYELYRKTKTGLPGVQELPTLETLLDLYKEKWIPLGYESKQQEEKRFKKGLKVLEAFYKKFITPEDNPIYLEQGFKIPNTKEKFVLAGTIDRIDDLGNGEVEIIDYKTGSVKSQKEVENNNQLIIYTHAVEKLFDKKVAKVSLLFIDELKKVSAVPKREKIDSVMEEVETVVKKIRAGDFTPPPGFICRFCEYKTICPYPHM